MTDINFYHVTTTSLEKACSQLLEKCYQTGKHTLVKIEDPSLLELINDNLWTFSQKSFVPHGSVNDPHPEIQPILITNNEENINNGEILVVVGCNHSKLTSFNKVLVVFSDSNEEQKILARQLYKFYKNSQNVIYYQQDSKGAWNKLQT